MSKRACAFLSVAFALAIGAPASAEMPEETKGGAEPARLVCKAQQQTGTRFKKRTCRTAQEWEEIAERHRRNGQEMIQRPNLLAQDKPG